MQNMHHKMYPYGIAAEINLYHGTHITPPDFVKVAQSVGGYGEQVSDPEPTDVFAPSTRLKERVSTPAAAMTERSAKTLKRTLAMDQCALPCSSAAFFLSHFRCWSGSVPPSS